MDTIATNRGLLLNTDCMDLLTAVKSNSIACVFADPPFNLKKDYGEAVSDDRPDADYISWSKRWLKECIRVLKPGGSLFVYNIPRWQITVGAWLMDQRPLMFRHWISISMKNTPPRGNRLYPAHYGLLYFSKGEPRVFNKDLVRVPVPTCRHCGKPIPDWGGYKDKMHPDGVNLSDIWSDVEPFGQAACATCTDLSDVWEDTSPVRHRRYKARAFGVNELDPKIPERAIKFTTTVDDVVLDPFGGGGTTFRMAEKWQRFWIGSEIADCTQIQDGLKACGAEFTSGPPEQVRGLFRKGATLTKTLAKPQV